jgi:hypothetical protein
VLAVVEMVVVIQAQQLLQERQILVAEVEVTLQQGLHPAVMVVLVL